MGYMGNEHKKCSFLYEIRYPSRLCDMECACRGLFFVGLVFMLIMAFVGYVRYTCDIYHDFVSVISLYRRVFKITVSNVSNVSNLYFSRAYA